MSGTLFLVLGKLLLIIHEKVRLKVGVLPFSMVLTLVLVAGAVMLGIGIVYIQKLTATFEREICKPWKTYAGGREKKTIVGIAFGEVVRESGLARLGSIGVHPEHQGQGIGKALLKEFVEHCRRKGCHKVT